MTPYLTLRSSGSDAPTEGRDVPRRGRFGGSRPAGVSVGPTSLMIISYLGGAGGATGDQLASMFAAGSTGPLGQSTL